MSGYLTEAGEHERRSWQDEEGGIRTEFPCAVWLVSKPHVRSTLKIGFAGLGNLRPLSVKGGRCFQRYLQTNQGFYPLASRFSRND